MARTAEDSRSSTEERYRKDMKEEEEIDEEVKRAFENPDTFYSNISKLSRRYGDRKVQESMKRLKNRYIPGRDNISIFERGARD